MCMNSCSACAIRWYWVARADRVAFRFARSNDASAFWVLRLAKFCFAYPLDAIHEDEVALPRRQDTQLLRLTKSKTKIRNASCRMSIRTQGCRRVLL